MGIYTIDTDQLRRYCTAPMNFAMSSFFSHGVSHLLQFISVVYLINFLLFLCSLSTFTMSPTVLEGITSFALTLT